jgi:hypothetical protein
MRLDDLAGRIEARILTDTAAAARPIEHVYAGDRISDLLSHASDTTLLVSNLSGAQLLRLAELMDVPAICLVGGLQPDAEFVSAAESHGTVVMASPAGMFETCGRIYQCLLEAKRVGP